jgi:HEAT repeat protein
MLQRLFPEVRSVERQRFASSFTLAALLLAGQAVGGTTAESLLLSRLGVQALPTAMVAASLTTIVGASLYSRWVGRRRNEVSFLIMLALGMTFLGLSIPLVQARSEPVYVALFCFNWLTFTLYYSHFFTLVGDYFDTLAMKRLLPLFVVGSTCGEIGGGLAASWVSASLGAQGLLFLWIGCQGLSALFLWSLKPKLTAWNPPSQGDSRRAARATVAPSGWAYLKRSSLGKALAIMAAAMMVTNTVVQYLHADIFLRSFSGEGQLASFLGMFTAVTNMVELVIGARVTPWLVRRFGVAQTNLVQPVGTVLTMLLLSWHYALIPAMLAWMNRKMLQDSLAAPTRAMLYSAFPARFRGPVRASVDGVFGAGSQAIAGVGLGLLQHHMAVADLVWVGLALAAAYVASAWRVRTVYLATLVDDLSQSRLLLPETAERSSGPRRTTPLLGPEEAGDQLPAGPEELGRWAAGHDEARAMLALVRLQGSPDPLATVVIARSLDDPRLPLRQTASRALAHRGEDTLPHLEPYFRAPAAATVQAAYEAVAGAGGARGRDMLAQELRLLVREALRHLFLAEAATKQTVPVLRLALEDHCYRCQRLAYKVLSLLEGEQLMAPVMNSLRFANAAARANAMEVLSNLGDREAAGLLVLLTESSSRADKLSAAGRLVPSLAEVPSELNGLLERCSHSSAPFVRRAAALAMPGGSDPGLLRLARLKSYDLFESLCLEELEGVADYLVTERFGPGETVVGRGHGNDRLYLTLEGRVEPAVNIFGVTPLLDGGAQRFTVTACETATFWSLRGEHLHTLIGRYPEIGLSLFRRLARQLKQQEGRLKSQPG